MLERRLLPHARMGAPVHGAPGPLSGVTTTSHALCGQRKTDACTQLPLRGTLGIGARGRYTGGSMQAAFRGLACAI